MLLCLHNSIQGRFSVTIVVQILMRFALTSLSIVTARGFISAKSEYVLCALSCRVCCFAFMLFAAFAVYCLLFAIFSVLLSSAEWFTSADSLCLFAMINQNFAMINPNLQNGQSQLSRPISAPAE